MRETNIFITREKDGTFSLWGFHGGELELVRIELHGGKAHLICTDHDVQTCKDAPENKVYYRVIAPLNVSSKYELYTEENGCPCHKLKQVEILLNKICVHCIKNGEQGQLCNRNNFEFRLGCLELILKTDGRILI